MARKSVNYGSEKLTRENALHCIQKVLSDGKEHSRSEAITAAAKIMGLTDTDLEERFPSGDLVYYEYLHTALYREVAREDPEGNPVYERVDRGVYRLKSSPHTPHQSPTENTPKPTKAQEEKINNDTKDKEWKGFKKVEIENFKKVQKITLEIAPRITLIMGKNNSGKSSVLQAMHFFNTLAIEAQNRIPEHKNSYGKASFQQADLPYVPAIDAVNLRHNEPITLKRTMGITFWQEKGQEDESYNIKVNAGKNGNIVVQSTKEINKIAKEFSRPLTAFVPGISGVSIQERPVYPPQLQKAASHGDSNIYLRNILMHLNSSDPERWDLFNRNFAKVYTGYNFNIDSDPEKDEFIKVSVSHPSPTGKNTYRNIEELGTGALQVAQILAYFFYYRPRLLLLDEPEVHLHPDLQKKLIKRLTKIATDPAETQIIINSHSRHVLDALLRESHENLDQALMIDYPRSGGEHFVTKITDDNALENIEKLGAQDFKKDVSFVVYTEDSNTSLLEKLLEANGFNLEEGQILTYEGIKNFNRIKIFDEFHTKRDHYSKSTPVIIWRDSDLAPREIALNHWQKICSSFQGCLITSWPGSAVEGEFIHAAQKTKIDIEGLLKDDKKLRAHAILGANKSFEILGLEQWPDSILEELVSNRELKHGFLGSTKSKELFKKLKSMLRGQEKKRMISPEPELLEREDLKWLAKQIKERRNREEIHDLWTAKNQESFLECKGFREPQAERSQKLESLLSKEFEALRIKEYVD